MRKDTISNLMRLTVLFDFYGKLLKPQYQKCVEGYLDEDLSMPEIAENLGVSRQYIHTVLNKAVAELEDFDQKLNLIETDRKNRETKTSLKAAVQGLEGHLDEDGRRQLKRIDKILNRIESGGPYGI